MLHLISSEESSWFKALVGSAKPAFLKLCHIHIKKIVHGKRCPFLYCATNPPSPPPHSPDHLLEPRGVLLPVSPTQGADPSPPSCTSSDGRLASDVAEPYQIWDKQRSCADMNSPYKRKC
jgi:hypothetical protein